MYIYCQRRRTCVISKILDYLKDIYTRVSFADQKETLQKIPPSTNQCNLQEKINSAKIFWLNWFCCTFSLAILLGTLRRMKIAFPLCSSRPYPFHLAESPAVTRSPPLVYADTVISTGRPHVVVATLPVPAGETAPNSLSRRCRLQSNFPLRGFVRSTEWILRCRVGVRCCVTVWAIVGIMGQSDSQVSFSFFYLVLFRAFCVLLGIFYFFYGGYTK